MMRAAVKGLTREDGSRPLLIAVTMLTSIDEERMNGELGIQGLAARYGHEVCALCA